MNIRTINHSNPYDDEDGKWFTQKNNKSQRFLSKLSPRQEAPKNDFFDQLKQKKAKNRLRMSPGF